MTKANSTKKALLSSAFALLVCVAMLIGTTFAWFTDTASTAVNKIQAGTLDVALEMKEGDEWVNAEGQTLQFKTADGRAENILWEPGCTYELPELRVVNNGNLALKFYLKLNGINGNAKLLEAIEWTMSAYDGMLTFPNHDAEVTKLLPEKNWEFKLSAHMKKTAGNEYQDLSIDGIGITVVATQDTYEKDSTGDRYDENATYPAVDQTELSSLLNAGKIAALGKDITANDTITVRSGKSTLDLNGKKIDNSADIWNESTGKWSLLSATGNATNLTVTGNGTFAAKENDCYVADVQNGATLTIKNGTFTGNIHAVYVTEGIAKIEGGFYSVQQKYPQADKANEFVLNCLDANYANGTAKIIVTGGTFVNFNPADCAAEGAHTNFVADGYKVVSETQANGDIWYTVVAE